MLMKYKQNKKNFFRIFIAFKLKEDFSSSSKKLVFCILVHIITERLGCSSIMGTSNEQCW